MSQKRAKQPRPKQMSDAVKMASYMADPSFVWHMVDMDSDEDGPVTLCGIGTHAGAKRGWRYGSDGAPKEGFTPKLDWVTCPDCKRIFASQQDA